MKLKILIFLFLIGAPFLFNLYSLDNIIISSHGSGIYGNDIELSLTAVSDFDIYYHFEESLDKKDVKYLYPLSLTAMTGENRSYSLVVTAVDEDEILETKKIGYVIDKDIPDHPVLNKNDGLYNENLNLQFIDSEADIYYSIQSSGENNYNLWDGEIINIQQDENLNTEFIKSYCQDSAGNRSSVSVNNFTVLPAVEKNLPLEVLSPVEGTFLNHQLIYIDTADYKWIRYSFNNIDPVTRGTSYIKPVLLKSPGEYKLNIAALPLNSEKILTREIIFSILDNQNISINKESGVYTEDIHLKFNKTGMNYNFEERTVVSWDAVLPDTINFMPVPGVVKYRSLRVADPSGVGEYRYFFILDRRIPAAPIISIADESPVATDTEVRILGVQGADIFYTLDGSSPDRYSSYYKRPFIMKIPEERKSGSMIIKAIAYFSDKSTSLVTSKLITFDITKPEKPLLAITSSELSQTSFSITNNISSKIIYTVSYDGTEPEDPSVTSFVGKNNMEVRVPHGIQSDVQVKVSFIDRAGNISESSTIELLDVDTVPPEEPEIIIDNNIATILGDEEIYYKIHDNSNKETAEYQLYDSPIVLDFQDRNYLNYVILSYSVDKKGNKSSTAISDEILVDSRIPVLPDYSGVSHGEIYNNPRSLRFHSTDDIKIYYTISTELTPPEDPIPGVSNLINEYLYFDCPVNEIRQYTVKLLASYNNIEIVSSSETISFNIDRIAPRSPVITSVINGTVYNEDITIDKNEEEDKVWILIKDQIEPSDLNFPYFESNGILLANDYIVKLEEKTEKKYQLSALSIDHAGNTNISREVIHFSIDKLPPEPPEIKVEEISDKSAVIRIISNESDEILYEITEDGSYPDEPDLESEIYQFPIQIQNKKSNSIYISARTIDASGNLSEITSLEKITFRNEDSISPVINIGKLNSTESSISFASLTGRKIFLKEGDGSFLEYTNPVIVDLRNRDSIDLFYYSIDNAGNKSSVAVSRLEKTSSSGDIITGISNNKIYNTGRVVWKSNESRVVRYEVAIDDELLDSVTVFSPELTEPIVFDSADGETLKVSLNVKEFMNDVPILEKYDTNFSFIIDKTKPTVPTILGAEDGAFFKNNRIVELNSDEAVYYNLSSGENNLNSVDFKKYDKPIEINVSEGKYGEFKIEFYSKDSGGNRSEIKIVEFTIDKANIYVSSKGKDSNDGTRGRPFKTLERAMEFRDQSKRKVLNLSVGEFMLESILDLGDDITLIGGFDTDEWTYGYGQTVINISKRFSGNSAMINIYSGNIILDKISLSNINLNAPMITMSGGSLLLNKVTLFHGNGKTPVALDIKNADLTLNESELIFGPISNGNLINAINSNIILESVKIRGTGNSGTLKILNLEKTKAFINNSNFYPSVSQKIELINSLNSDLKINSTYFDTGTASINANLFVIKDSDLIMKKIEVGSVKNSRILSGFDVVNSMIEIEESNFNLKANSGISFIRMLDSSLELSNTEIKSENTVEFVYLLQCSSSITNFENNKIFVGATDIFTGFDSNNSVSIFKDNVMTFLGGNTVFTAFTFQKPLSIEFLSNSLISSNISWISSENQAAINILSGKDRVIINENNILGWKAVLKHKDKILQSVEELNSYRGFLDVPNGNYSVAD